MPSTLLTTHEDAYSDVQMPNVFVVPPEEDDSPTWCCFNASESTCLDDPLSTLEFEPDIPWSHDYSLDPFALQDGTTVLGKGRETRSILDVLMNDDYMESDEEMVEELEPEPDTPETDFEITDVGNDSMVVEVVKVQRYIEDIQDQTCASSPPTKSSKSFKERASMALRSLVGKGSIRSKSKALSIASSTNEPPPRGRTPVSRSSGMLSQIFLPSSTIQARESVSSFEATQNIARHPSRSKKVRYPSSLHNGHPHTFASLRSSSAPTPEPDDSQSPPSPSTNSQSNRRRFSMMSLNRIFSSPQTDEASDSIPNTVPRHSSGPSMESSSGPETPTDELIHIPRGQAGPSKDHDYLAQEDISFEMKLDSLHFDDLSFDVDRF